MKSIMEEASSISKAVEKGWLRAGKPQEFTVKVFEEAQKNFIGLTVKSAKIGIFFEEPILKHTSRESRSLPPRKPQTAQPSNIQQQRPSTHQAHPKNPLSMQQPTASLSRPLNKETPTTSSPWNQELVASAQEWVKDSLSLLGLSSIQFTIDIDRFALKISFNKPLMESIEKEKMLFRSWAYLIMQALRQKYKRPLKGLKIILMSAT